MDSLLPTTNDLHRRNKSTNTQPEWIIPNTTNVDPENNDPYEDVLDSSTTDPLPVPPTDFSTSTFMNDLRSTGTEIKNIVSSLFYKK